MHINSSRNNRQILRYMSIIRNQVPQAAKGIYYEYVTLQAKSAHGLMEYMP